MGIEDYTRKVYDQFGKEYQRTRDERRAERAFNEFLELPCMLKAVGAIKGKRLLDVGCGAGVHAQRYLKKGAEVYGMDISKTMIDLAKQRCKGAEFKVGSAEKLPYKNNFFDMVTASLCMNYVDDIEKAFREANRVLKKEGLFYYSDASPISGAREEYEDENIKAKGVGKIIYKDGSKKIFLGQAWSEFIDPFEMVPGMIIKAYKRTFRTNLKAIRQAGFELVDFIDCKPTPVFKRYNPQEYELFSKMPLFSIYVCKKK